MKKIENIAIGLALAFCAAFIPSGAVFAATSGSISLDKEGWDKPWTTTVTVNRGQEHTFWVTGLTADTGVSGVFVEGTYSYTEDGETWEDSVAASMSVDEHDDDYNVTGYYVLLTADDWDYVPDSVKAVKFTVTVDGWYDADTPANNKFTFNHASGRDRFPEDLWSAAQEADDPDEPVIVIPTGASTRPFATSAKQVAFPTNMADCAVLSSAILSEEYEEEDDINEEVCNTAELTTGAKTYTNCWTGCREAYEVVPNRTGTYRFVLSGDVGEAFTFCLAVKPTRSPAQHDSAKVALGAISEPFVPGYLNAPESGSYDGVVDERLFEVSGFMKGSNYIFRTYGATSPIHMLLYDAQGKVLAENYYASNAGYDAQIAWKGLAATVKTSKYYIGICQDIDEENGEIPLATSPITFGVEPVTLEDEVADVQVTVTPSSEVSPFEANGIKVCTPRELGPTSWYNTYVILGGRKGVTKCMACILASPDILLQCKSSLTYGLWPLGHRSLKL